MAEVTSIDVLDKDGVPRTVATNTALKNLIGEVAASPTANTVLARLKTGNTSLASLETKIDTLLTAIGTAADAAGDPTVIGLLKQIADNTAP